MEDEKEVTMDECLFCKITEKKINASIIYEDPRAIAFRDINPQAPFHALIVPKRHIPTVTDLKKEDKELVGYLYLVAKEIAEKEGISEQGFRMVTNCRAFGGQTVYHLHIHILGGRFMGWPPG